MDRCFLGLSLPPSLTASLLETVGSLASPPTKAPSPFHLTPEANLHLTLKFLGDTTSLQIQSLCEGLPTFHPYLELPSIRVHGVGAFPSPQSPKAVFAGIGIGTGTTSLVTLGNALDQLCEPLGFTPETRARIPHITLARVRSEADDEHRAQLGSWLQRFDSTPLGLLFDAQSPSGSEETLLCLYRSHLRPSGSHYERLCHVPLGRENQ